MPRRVREQQKSSVGMEEQRASRAQQKHDTEFFHGACFGVSLFQIAKGMAAAHHTQQKDVLVDICSGFTAAMSWEGLYVEGPSGVVHRKPSID